MAFESILSWAKNTNRLIKKPRVKHILYLALPLCVLLKILYFAWVAEDAYITFRVVDNFMHGYGLTWNISERVQVYTHPLWMLLHIPLYWLTGDVFYTTIFFSAALSMATFLMLAKPLKDKPLALISLVFLPLFFSSSFIDYSTSGLENPLTHLLLIAFGTLFLSFKDKTPPWVLLALFASLAAFNRMDTALFFVPAALYLLWCHFRNIRILHCILGVLPFVLWLVFSFIYYGFIFPNTKYAKLNTGIDSWSLLEQSALYLHYLFINDLPAACFVVLATLSVLHQSFVALKTRSMDALRYSAMGSGLLLYLLYLVVIGGDYMSGRLVSPMIVLSCLLLSHYARFIKKSKREFITGYIGIWLLVLAVIGNSIKLPIRVFPGGVANERLFYADTNSLIVNLFDSSTLHSHAWIAEGIYIREQASCIKNPPHFNTTLIRANAGMLPFFAGPLVHFIDPHGLGDPLLARLPLRQTLGWRIGHFFRTVPIGYLHAIETGSRMGMDSDLADYYGVLSYITSGEIWDIKRLNTALRFNLGHYDYLVRSYVDRVYNQRVFPLSHLSHLKQDGFIRWFNTRFTADPYNLTFGKNTVFEMHAPRILHPRYMDTYVQDLYGYSNNNGYFVYGFYKQGKLIHSINLRQESSGYQNLPKRRYLVEIPEDLRTAGFDTITIINTSGGERKMIPAMLMHMVFRDCLTCGPIASE